MGIEIWDERGAAAQDLGRSAGGTPVNVPSLCPRFFPRTASVRFASEWLRLVAKCRSAGRDRKTPTQSQRARLNGAPGRTLSDRRRHPRYRWSPFSSVRFLRSRIEAHLVHLRLFDFRKYSHAEYLSCSPNPREV